MSANVPTVWTFGEPLVALVTSERQRIEDAPALQPYVAGAELNVAIALTRLGIQVGYGAAIGSDPFGQLIKKVLRAEGVGSEFVVENPAQPTGLLLKEWQGASSEPSVHYMRKGSAASNLPIERWEKDLMQAPWVHLSGITPMLSAVNHDAVRRIWPRLPGIRSLDLNVRYKLGGLEGWRTTLEPLCSDAALIFGSSEEFRQLWDCDRQEVRQAMGLRDSQVVIGTEGKDGAWVDTGEDFYQVPVVPTVVVDPVGAGDGFAAGVIAGRQWGWSWDKASQLGMVIGASAVAVRGDYQGYPYYREAMDWINATWVSR